MRKFIVSVVFSICILLLGCYSKSNNEEERATVKKSEADYIIREITYIKDPRTNICFAYYEVRSPAGGLALTSVPCEKIPPHILTTATIK